MVGSVAVAMVVVVGGGDGGEHATEDKIVGDVCAANEQPAEEKNVSNGHSGYKISGRDVLRWM